MDIQSSAVCLLMAAMMVMFMVRCEDENTLPKEPCQGNHHVCTTLMKYPDGYVANEGPYCTCSVGECGSAWSEDDGRALTWKHYERGHWKVQYRFCTPLMHEVPLCEKGKRASVIKTEISAWKPYIEEPRCRCPEGLQHMAGWKKDGKVWKYFYQCDKIDCNGNGDVCATILVDTNKKTDIVKEVKFHCACPHGSLCPAKVKDESKVQGKEILIRCEEIQQSSNKNDKLKESLKKKKD